MSSYKRKSSRGKWTPESMQEAINKVRSREMTLGQASEAYEVSKTTLFRRVSMKNKVVRDVEKYLGGHKKVFDAAFEKDLEEYVLDMSTRFFGITNTELRVMAYELAERNSVPHSFNRTKMCAGKKWLYSFRKRHPNLSLRKPEATSYARATGFNKPAVLKFFNLLGELITKHQLDGSRIYNCDESGMKTVQQQQAKILAKTGVKQVGALTSSERGKNVTVICTCNGCGQFVPPCFIFPRKRENPILMDHAPTSSKGFFQETGWMNGETFVKYMNHFIEHVKPSVEKPCLLILDGHASHTKSLEVLDLARASGVIMLSLPPHTTHRLQPLDVGFFKPLQTYYDRYIDRWLKIHPGRIFSEYQVAEAFTDAYGKAGTIETISNAFRKCGIWPFNPDLFSDADFAAAETTDRPLDHNYSASSSLIPDTTVTVTPVHSATKPSTTGEPSIVHSVTLAQSVAESSTTGEPSIVHSVMPAQSVAESSTVPLIDDPVTVPPVEPSTVHSVMAAQSVAESSTVLHETPSCATCQFVAESVETTPKTGTAPTSFYRKSGTGKSPGRLIIEAQFPLPSAPLAKARKRAGQCSTVLTSSPYKKKLIDDKDKRRPVNLKLAKRPDQQKEKQQAKKLKEPKSQKVTKKGKGKQVVRKSQKKCIEQHSKPTDEDDCLCIVCGESFADCNNGENWIQCTGCMQWSHELCTGVESQQTDYKCDSCANDSD